MDGKSKKKEQRDGWMDRKMYMRWMDGIEKMRQAEGKIM